MLRFHIALGVPILFLASFASAEELVLVPGQEFCAMDRQTRNEQTTTMYLNYDAVTFEAIEYYCEFGAFDPGNWRRSKVETLIGYCSEPGVFTPEMRVFVISDGLSGVIEVYHENGEKVEYVTCER